MAPVSGGPRRASAGTIAIMVRAPTELFAKIKPIFETISPNIFHIADVGTGHVMKLVDNVISAGARSQLRSLVDGHHNVLGLKT